MSSGLLVSDNPRAFVTDGIRTFIIGQEHALHSSAAVISVVMPNLYSLSTSVSISVLGVQDLTKTIISLYGWSFQKRMKFLILLLFIGSLLENGLSGKVGPKIWSDGLSQDLTKAGKTFDKWLDADSGMEGRIVGGEQAGMKDAPWQVMPYNKCSTMPHNTCWQSVSSDFHTRLKLLLLLQH